MRESPLFDGQDFESIHNGNRTIVWAFKRFWPRMNLILTRIDQPARYMGPPWVKKTYMQLANPLNQHSPPYQLELAGFGSTHIAKTHL